MIDLHRADSRLMQANAVRLDWKGDGKEIFAFRETCLRLFRKELASDPPEKLDPGQSYLLKQRRVLRDEHFGGDDSFKRLASSKEIRKVKSLAQDAIRFLERAEPILRERRRNVWWTTWFFERKLRAIATLVWCSLFETGQPIPFLGLEAAMRKTETSPDILLADAVRMIRVDCYRLASAIHAYSLRQRGLQLRLLWDPTTPALPGRLRTTRKNLEFALEQLGGAYRRREYAEGDLRLVERVYIEAVKQDASAVIKSLDKWDIGA